MVGQLVSEASSLQSQSFFLLRSHRTSNVLLLLFICRLLWRPVQHRTNSTFQAVPVGGSALTKPEYDFWTDTVIKIKRWCARDDTGPVAGWGSTRLFFAIFEDLHVRPSTSLFV